MFHNGKCFTNVKVPQWFNRFGETDPWSSNHNGETPRDGVSPLAVGFEPARTEPVEVHPPWRISPSWSPLISRDTKKPLISTVLRDTPAAPQGIAEPMFRCTTGGAPQVMGAPQAASTGGAPAPRWAPGDASLDFKQKFVFESLNHIEFKFCLIENTMNPT